MRLYDILSYGVIGLGFILAMLAYQLLTREQQQRSGRSKILRAIYGFMIFSVVLCLIGFFAQFLAPVYPPRSSYVPNTSTVASDAQTNHYYVVVASTLDHTEAWRVADKVKAAGFNCCVYSSNSGSLAVAVANATKEAAEVVRSQLVRKGLSKSDAYVSTGVGFVKQLTR
jgi:hypothetical protein